MDFMSEFRPREATVQLAELHTQGINQLDQHIKAFNNPAMKQFASQLMAAHLLLHQWAISQTTDLADYAQAIASRLEGGGLDDEDFELLAGVHAHLEELQKLFEEMKGLLPPNVLALGEKNKTLMAALGEILESDAVAEDEDTPLFEDEAEAKEPDAEVIR